ncbi:MAG TPA: diaminobutyrate acetyltransferase [Methanobacterium sp.]
METKFRKPELSDGESIYFLAQSCPPLEINSIYSYLLVCSHFDQTSAVCEYKGDIVGFVSGYVHPYQDDTLFIWQVAVSDHMRGKGIAKQMLLHILKRRELGNIRHVEATVTQGNESSRALFTGLAGHLDAPVSEECYFGQEVFLESRHQEEFLISIGPFTFLK